MQIRINDLRNRVEILRKRVDAMGENANTLKMSLKAKEPINEYELDSLCQYYIERGRQLEAENILHVKGVPGM